MLGRWTQQLAEKGWQLTSELALCSPDADALGAAGDPSHHAVVYDGQALCKRRHQPQVPSCARTQNRERLGEVLRRCVHVTAMGTTSSQATSGESGVGLSIPDDNALLWQLILTSWFSQSAPTARNSSIMSGRLDL